MPVRVVERRQDPGGDLERALGKQSTAAREQLPRLLRFESNSLTPRDEVDATVARWRERGYAVDEERTLASRARPGYEETFMRREW